MSKPFYVPAEKSELQFEAVRGDYLHLTLAFRTLGKVKGEVVPLLN
jgi:hypothetical protein